MRRPGNSKLLEVIALLLFLAAVVVALGDASVRGEAALIPGGLAAWLFSTMVP